MLRRDLSSFQAPSVTRSRALTELKAAEGPMKGAETSQAQYKYIIVYVVHMCYIQNTYIPTNLAKLVKHHIVVFNVHALGTLLNI